MKIRSDGSVGLPDGRPGARRRRLWRRRRDGGGGGGGTEESSGGGNLTVYSSLPLQGASRPQSEDVINGIKLALKQKGGKSGDFTINYKSLDDATAAAGQWEAGATAGERPQGRAGRQRHRLHRRVQLRRLGDLDPDHQRGRHPAGLARRTPRSA